MTKKKQPAISKRRQKKRDQQDAATEAATEAAKKLDELHEAVTKKKHWAIRGIQAIASPFLKIKGLLLGGTAGAVVATFFGYYNLNDSLLDEFSTIHSSGPCIHGGHGSTAYTDLGNQFSRALADAGHEGYGFCDPSPGSNINLNRLSPELDSYSPENEKSFAIAQKDSFLQAHEAGEIPHAEILLDLQHLPECALTPVNSNFDSLEDLIEYSEAQASLKENGQDHTPLKIGVIREGSGSYTTGMNITAALFNLEATQVTEYNNAIQMIKAIESEEIDSAFFVEYPGHVQGKFQEELQVLFNTKVKLVSMPQDIFETHFANAPQQYQYLQPTILREFSLNPTTWKEFISEAERKLPPMLCTNPVIAMRTLDSIANEAVREHYIAPLQDDVRARINGNDIVISTKLQTQHSVTTEDGFIF